MKKIILLLMLMGALCGNVQVSYADSSGPRSLGTVVDDASIGSYVWNNPNNVKISDNVYTTTYRSNRYGWYDYAVKIVKGGMVGSTNKARTELWPLSESYISYGNPLDLWGEIWTPANINDPNFGVVFSDYAAFPDTQSHYLKVTNFGFSIPAEATINGILVEIEKYQKQDSAYVDHICMTVYYTETEPIVEPNIVDVNLGKHRHYHMKWEFPDVNSAEDFYETYYFRIGDVNKTFTADEFFTLLGFDMNDK